MCRHDGEVELAVLTFAAVALQETVKLLEEAIDETKTKLANRLAVPDFHTYCALAGRIEGLRMAVDLCEEAVRKVNED